MNINQQLHKAIVDRNVEKIESLLNQGVDPNVVFEDGNSLLITAINYEAERIVDLLIEYGADVDFSGKVYTPLTAAIRVQCEVKLMREMMEMEDVNNKGFIMVQKLIDARADVNKKNPSGASPLEEASPCGLADTVLLLLENDADVNNRSRVAPILSRAAENGRLEVVMLLIAYGADVNEKDGDGNTPLMNAAESYSDRKKAYKTAEYLLDHGADIDEKNDIGDTALIIAAKKSDDKFVKLLLRRGANPHERNDQGETVMDIAEKEGLWGMINLLREYF